MIKKLLIPGAFDSYLIIIGWILWGMFVLGSLLAVGTQYFAEPELREFYFHTMAAILVGSAAVVMQGIFHRLRALTVVSLAVLAPLFVYYIANFLLNHPQYQILNLQPPGFGSYFGQSSPDLLLDDTKNLFFVLIGSLIVFALIRLCIYLVINSRISRKTILISVAVGLFILKILGDVLSLNFPFLQNGQYLALLLSAFLAVLLAVVAYFVPKFVLVRRFFRSKVLLAITGLAAVLGAGWFFYTEAPELLLPLANYSLCAVLFLASCLACARFPNEHSQEESEDSPESKSRLSWIPSVWSMLVLTFFAGSLWGAFQVDELVLLQTKDWKQAAAAQKIIWDTAGAVKLLSASGDVVVQINDKTPANALKGLEDWTPTGLVSFDIKLSENLSPDALNGLEGWPASTILISGYGPQVDFSFCESLTDLPLLHLHEGKLSPDQMGHVLSQPITQLYASNFEVLGKGSVNPKKIQSMMVYDCPANFLKSIGSFEPVTQIISYGPQDWPTLARASATSKITANGLKDLPEPSELAGATQQLRVSGERFNLSIDDVRQLLSKTKIAIDCVPLGSERSEESDMAWVKLGWRFPGQLTVYLGETDLKFQFAHDEQGQVTGLLLPTQNSEENLGDFPKLKILSLDPSWLSENQLNSGNIRFGDLSQLTELESLYLVSGIHFEPYDYLANQTTLRHLQVPVDQWYLYGALRFNPSMSLESVCILGVPDDSFLKGLTLLPKLKKLSVVDTELEFSSPEDSTISKAQFLKNVKTLLPNVAISIKTPEEHRLDIPSEFKEYKDRILEDGILGQNVDGDR